MTVAEWIAQNVERAPEPSIEQSDALRRVLLSEQARDA